MNEVDGVKPSNSPGNTDNKVDKLTFAIKLLIKQVPTLQYEIGNMMVIGQT